MTWLKLLVLAALPLFSSALLLSAETCPNLAGSGEASAAESLEGEGAPMHVQKMFAQALLRIWFEAGAGNRGYEAGFALNRVGNDYLIVYAPMTYAPNMELAIPINTVGITVAIAHTHPNTARDVPSSEGHGGFGKGDVFSPVPNYVVSKSGLWVTRPADHTYRQVSGPDWGHNLRPLEFRNLLNPPNLAAQTVASSAVGLDTGQKANAFAQAP